VSEDEWLWGWDPTPGIVSVWAEPDGRAFVWRRQPETRALIYERERFRPWLLLSSLDDLRHLGASLQREGANTANGANAGVCYRELDGPGALRFIASADDGRALTHALLQGASRRLGRTIAHVRELGSDAAVALPPEEQYLVATGRNYFRELRFDDLVRMQLDLETTGLNPAHDRVFMIALRDDEGRSELL